MPTTSVSVEQEIKRTPCQVYTRVMGYLRPVSHFNVGKKSEFYSRKYFDGLKASNTEFIAQYGNLWHSTRSDA